jgi:tRNA splicing ligase
MLSNTQKHSDAEIKLLQYKYRMPWMHCRQNGWVNEMTKITISNQSSKSKRKYKSENGRTRTSEYIRGGIRCHGRVSIPC